MLLDYILYFPSLIFQSIRLAGTVIYPLNWHISLLSLLHAVNGAYIYRRNLLKENVKVPFIQGFGKYLFIINNIKKYLICYINMLIHFYIFKFY